MHSIVTILSFAVVFFNFAICNDFYLGMFKKNDYLMAQDRLYKERVPFMTNYAKYGRVFKCPITYIRVVDRLGYGKSPRTELMRGGLQKKYVMLRITAHNKPISVNIYVGCENKGQLSTTKLSTVAGANATTGKVAGNDTQTTEVVTSAGGQVSDARQDTNSTKATNSTGGAAPEGGTPAAAATGETTAPSAAKQT